ncbi:type II secretion system secretin GspD [Pelovirga terrestris]|uniref:Type II secretion system secretin GspD n=1 Tax=Pelovirga terrestris TaxID=2771352 RepID=A0A8J6UL34_9BACT|nr:type II secretion system secretin GspD [Pelovirga terrestris]
MERKQYFPGRILVFWLVIALFCLSGSTIATADDEMMITLDFQNVELVDMIGTISELTGKNFLYDETVRGKVSILSPEPVSLDEAYRLFLTVLRVRGFAVVPAGGVNKIVALATAKEETLPFTNQRGLGDQHVTRILTVRHLDATVAVETIMRPLMPRTSHVVAHQATNTIVITDTAENIERLNRLLHILDKTWDNDRIELVPLRFADAADVAAMTMQILEGDGSVAPTTGRAARAAAPGKKRIAGQIIPYERTNTLALQGEQLFIDQAKELIAQLDVEVEAGFTGVHVYYLEHAEAEPLAETINQIIAGAARAPSAPRAAEGQQQAADLFKDVKVTADKPTNSLIINASQDEFRNVMSLIGQLDIKRKQVFVEALIMDLSMNAVLKLGTSLQGAIDVGNDSLLFGASGSTPASAAGLVTDGVSSVLNQAVEGIMLGGMFNPITYTVGDITMTVPALSALINLSQTDDDINVLSAPRLLTSDNEEAEIIVGENVPIITSRSSTSSGDNIISAVERQDAALILRFTPQITAGGLVRMKIHQEISGVKERGTGVGTEDNVGPTLTKTLLRNSIVARDGETVVLGGLFRNQVTKNVSKVPLLGDIPILGWLFKSTSDSEEKRSLLIFITPRVIHDTDDLSRLTTDTHRDLQLFRSEGGTEAFFDKQRMKTIGDFAVPLEN